MNTTLVMKIARPLGLSFMEAQTEYCAKVLHDELAKDEISEATRQVINMISFSKSFLQKQLMQAFASANNAYEMGTIMLMFLTYSGDLSKELMEKYKDTLSTFAKLARNNPTYNDLATQVRVDLWE